MEYETVSELKRISVQWKRIYNLKNSTKSKGINTYTKLLELINKFSKVAEHQTNMQKLCFYILTTNNENEIEKTILFTIVSKRINCLGINLTKEVQDLYTENYKILLKEDLNNRKDIGCPWIERLSIIQMAIVSKVYKDTIQSLPKSQWPIWRNGKFNPK